MNGTNEMSLTFASRSENESFARVTVAAFVSQLDPSMDELTDIKTVVSEAVTNAIIHGYNNDPNGKVRIEAKMENDRVYITVEDEGEGIDDIEQARQPLYTSRPELERSGMGLTIIENFMDEVEIQSGKGAGTRIRMMKRIKSGKPMYN